MIQGTDGEAVASYSQSFAGQHYKISNEVNSTIDRKDGTILKPDSNVTEVLQLQRLESDRGDNHINRLLPTMRRQSATSKSS